LRTQPTSVQKPKHSYNNFVSCVRTATLALGSAGNVFVVSVPAVSDPECLAPGVQGGSPF